MSQEWEMMAALSAYVVTNISVKYNEEQDDYEVLTPYQDQNGPIVLFAKVAGDKIRLTDGSYLSKHFMQQQVEGPFVVAMGVHSEDGGVVMEGEELVLYCTMADFGEAACALAYGIMTIGTSKMTMLTMLKIFKAAVGGHPGMNLSGHDPEPDATPGWPGGTPFEA